MNVQYLIKAQRIIRESLAQMDPNKVDDDDDDEEEDYEFVLYMPDFSWPKNRGCGLTWRRLGLMATAGRTSSDS